MSTRFSELCRVVATTSIIGERGIVGGTTGRRGTLDPWPTQAATGECDSEETTYITLDVIHSLIFSDFSPPVHPIR